jgi:ribosomal subunit interface protein
MDYPLEITYRDIERSQALDALIHEKVAKLERLFDHIIGIHVTIERPVHRSTGRNNPWRVRIELSVPNDMIVITREPNEHNDQYREDAFAAVRDAFERCTRKLQDYKARIQGHVKVSHVPPHARIIRVFPYEGYGFVATSEGRELYFHENAVVGSTIHELKPGMEVRFAESSDESGPHVSSLTPVGKQGHSADLPSAIPEGPHTR